jgi:hypothetical protein
VRLAASGHTVLLGSRDEAKARQRVAELHETWGDHVAGIRPVVNRDATNADVVVLATVAEAAVDTARELADHLHGRVLVSMANVLTKAPRGFAAVLPEDCSIAMVVQRTVPDARVVGAFQNLPARALQDLDLALDADVIVCGDDANAVAAVVDITRTIDGLRPVDGGPLTNASAVEAMTAILLNVNKARRAEHAVRIVELRRHGH